MTALAWILIAVQLLVTGQYAYRLTRLRHRGVREAYRPRRAASALVVVCVLPLLPLLATDTDAPAAAWGLWGVGYIAAALVYAFADTLRDIPSGAPTTAG
ncbi:hypothetical protein OHA74_14435 [Streptomyces phaeochromogenes]|uniref:hypothetical protein n=1 Tax=Streptomyces phaeochromogenes TaxID=1923 RepID=UPI002E2B5798|nr:hypothetical protein [Streptomyces phaeochromogenes]